MVQHVFYSLAPVKGFMYYISNHWSTPILVWFCWWALWSGKLLIVYLFKIVWIHSLQDVINKSMTISFLLFFSELFLWLIFTDTLSLYSKVSLTENVWSPFLWYTLSYGFFMLSGVCIHVVCLVRGNKHNNNMFSSMKFIHILFW